MHYRKYLWQQIPFCCQIYIRSNIFDKYTSTVFLPVVKMATSPYYRNTVEPEPNQIYLDNIDIPNTAVHVQFPIKPELKLWRLKECKVWWWVVFMLEVNKETKQCICFLRTVYPCKKNFIIIVMKGKNLIWIT